MQAVTAEFVNTTKGVVGDFQHPNRMASVLDYLGTFTTENLEACTTMQLPPAIGDLGEAPPPPEEEK
jgi:hypothetical protein